MKIKHLLLIIISILYIYWISDLYIFVFTHNVYNPNELDDYFNALKVSMYIVNYALFLIILIIFIPYNKINKILNKKININLLKKENYE
jgi:hypothetical protein